VNQTDTLEQATVIVDAEASVAAMTAQIVRYDITGPSAAALSYPGRYLINMCLTPRPLDARACYRHHWGSHRFERLGDIFLIPDGEELFIKGGSIRQASLLCNLDAESIHAIVGERLHWTDQQLATTVDIASARIRALLFRIAGEVRLPGLAAPRMLEFLAGELAIELGRHCIEVHERPIGGGLAGWRLRLIDERLAAEGAAPTLGELADVCSLSVRQLTRGFRVSRGCSIGHYVEQRRMEAAKRLLMAGESVKTIAFGMGFASPSSFTFAFRRATGISPSQFRQRQARSVEMA
jgi:AraC family transcriptional regulator